MFFVPFVIHPFNKTYCFITEYAAAARSACATNETLFICS